MRGLGCINIVFQISAPFIESVNEQTKNAKSFILCTPPPQKENNNNKNMTYMYMPNQGHKHANRSAKHK